MDYLTFCDYCGLKVKQCNFTQPVSVLRVNNNNE